MVRKKSNTGPKKYVKHVPTKKRKWTCEEVALALKEMDGHIYRTAEKLDINHGTLLRYFKIWPILYQVRKNCWGVIVDKVEKKLVDKALDGDMRAISRFLSAYKPKRYSRNKGQSKIDIGIQNQIVTSGQPQLTDDVKAKILDQVKQSIQEKQKQIDNLNRMEIGLKELPATNQEVVNDIPGDNGKGIETIKEENGELYHDVAGGSEAEVPRSIELRQEVEGGEKLE